MRWRNRLATSLDTAAYVIYHEYLYEPLCRIREVPHYRTIGQNYLYPLLVELSEPELTVEVAGVQSTFVIETPGEFFATVRQLQLERPVIEDVLARSNPSDVFMDIGANVGIYSCLVGQTVARTIAVEPVASNVEALKRNRDLNDVPCSVQQRALSDADEPVTLEVDRFGLEAGLASHRVAGTDELDGVQVEASRGDRLTADLSATPTVIKIDVEGHELEVIDGLETTLKDSCRLMYCELHPWTYENGVDSIPKIHDRLRELGFSTELVHERDDVRFIRGSK